MESIANTFQYLSYLIEVFSALMAVSGVLIVFKGYRLAGTLMALGGGLHFLGYSVMMFETEYTPLKQLLTSLMFPGLLLLTLGICLLAFTLRPLSKDA